MIPPRHFGIFSDDQTTVTGLPVGPLLAVAIIAHNEAGHSAESAVVTIMLH